MVRRGLFWRLLTSSQGEVGLVRVDPCCIRIWLSCSALVTLSHTCLVSDVLLHSKLVVFWQRHGRHLVLLSLVQVSVPFLDLLKLSFNYISWEALPRLVAEDSLLSLILLRVPRLWLGNVADALVFPRFSGLVPAGLMPVVLIPSFSLKLVLEYLHVAASLRTGLYRF